MSFQEGRKECCPLNLDRLSCCFQDQCCQSGKESSEKQNVQTGEKTWLQPAQFAQCGWDGLLWTGSFGMMLGEKSITCMTVLKYELTQAEQMGFITETPKM